MYSSNLTCACSLLCYLIMSLIICVRSPPNTKNKLHVLATHVQVENLCYKINTNNTNIANTIQVIGISEK